MSRSFLEITRDECFFNGSSLLTIGRFFWSQNGNFFPIDQQVGLCEDCDDIIAMASFPDLAVIERAKEIHPFYHLGNHLCDTLKMARQNILPANMLLEYLKV